MKRGSVRTRHAAKPNIWLMTQFREGHLPWRAHRAGLCGACAWLHSPGWSTAPWKTPQPPILDSRGVSQTDDPVFMKLFKCNEYPISQSQYYQWRDQVLAHASHAFEVQQLGLQEVRLA